MNSYASSLRVTDHSTEREKRGGNEKATTQTAVPMLLHPLYMSAALTTGVAVGVEATTPAMVGTFKNTSVSQNIRNDLCLCSQEQTLIKQTRPRLIQSVGMS